MASITLSEFIGVHRDELIGRCRAKVAQRSSPPVTEVEIARGVPLFLEQLASELRNGISKTSEISNSAVAHGQDLLRQGFTIGQVVHDYGDICQAITDLAVELAAPISTDDFRTLNRCLDDAIAAAVTEFGRAQDVAHAGESDEVLNLTNTAITAFDVLQTGNVGVGGSTGGWFVRACWPFVPSLIARARRSRSWFPHLPYQPHRPIGPTDRDAQDRGHDGGCRSEQAACVRLP